MKRFVLVSSLILGFGSNALGKQAAEARASQAQNAGGLPAETRMKALGEQVRAPGRRRPPRCAESRRLSRDAKSLEAAPEDPQAFCWLPAHVELRNV